MQEKKDQQNLTTSPTKPNFANRGSDGERNKKRWTKKSNANFQKPVEEFEEKVVKVRRVTKVTKGGRHFRFSVVVIVGNHKGKVGFATGKANEVPDAIKKAAKAAKKNTFMIPMVGVTVPHDVIGHYGGGRVLIKPARKGTGIIAGGPVRTLIEVSGVQDIYVKSLGSNTSLIMIRAAMDGLKQMRTKEQVYSLREIKEKVSEKSLAREQ